MLLGVWCSSRVAVVGGWRLVVAVVSCFVLLCDGCCALLNARCSCYVVGVGVVCCLLMVAYCLLFGIDCCVGACCVLCGVCCKLLVVCC